MRKFLIIILGCFFSVSMTGQDENGELLLLNKPEREQWFTELGFGMFIHWSYDVVLGSVISHSMVGASDDYLDRYINELPQRFNPQRFDPGKWARLARDAGMKYMVFTAKHHNGFCMYNTRTTDYNIMNTPFGEDATKAYIDACRKEGLAVGLYFSPEDFYFLHQQGRLVSRRREESKLTSNPDLIEYVKNQMRELMTSYGTIDIVFLDGGDGYGRNQVSKVCWEVNPDVVVTRGAMETPEQSKPGEPIPSPWESCITLGMQWQYRPTNETYKSCLDVIETLVDIRAKGGNLLLNLGPDADGMIPLEQEGIMNELSLWMFINKEVFEGTIPCDEYRDGDLCLLQSRDGKYTYAVYLDPDQKIWPYGARKEFVLRNYRMNEQSKISVLGHAGKVLEYAVNEDAAPRMENSEEGLKLDIMRAQRIYNDRQWPNPIVFKLESIEAE